MSIECTPHDALVFYHPLTKAHQTAVLTLTNTGVLPMAFKVQVTSSKAFIVRPPMGRVEAGQSLEVLVTHLALHTDPPLGTACRESVRVMSIALPPERELLLFRGDFWKDVPAPAVHEHLLACAYASRGARDARVLEAQLAEAHAELAHLRALAAHAPGPSGARTLRRATERRATVAPTMEAPAHGPRARSDSSATVTPESSRSSGSHTYASPAIGGEKEREKERGGFGTLRRVIQNFRDEKREAPPEYTLEDTSSG
ncbi:VAMP-associated protein [Phanerochaete sordida]|uniref:VAMP-associated protein n=1 Tax=Phanerochaete sordida TaxID=48140 RepID=A0A9P3G368_9APHY|nr:VAMP-associated protein [Phanerochaete sordida]